MDIEINSSYNCYQKSIIIIKYFLISLSFSVIISCIIIGSKYINSCPANNALPIFLLLLGIYNIIINIISIYIDIPSILSIISAILLIIIGIIIYDIYEPNYYDINDYNYCNKTLYFFSLYYLIIIFSMMIICFLIYLITFVIDIYYNM